MRSTIEGSINWPRLKIVADIKRALARQAAYRKTYNELSRLSNRELDDIGISRWMIADIAQDEANRF